MATAKSNISRRVRFSYATSTISMTLVLFLLGAIGFIMANLFSTTKRMRESVTMIVELKDGLSEAERDSVAVRLAESELVASLKFVSKEAKLEDEEFKRVFAVDIKGILGENPLPDSYDVTLSALSSNKEGLEKFAEEARKIEGVSYVTYPQSFIEDMHSTLDIMQFIMAVFGGALPLIHTHSFLAFGLVAAGYLLMELYAANSDNDATAFRGGSSMLFFMVRLKSPIRCQSARYCPSTSIEEKETVQAGMSIWM